MNKQPLHIKMDAELKEELKRYAEQDNRTLSNLIEKVLRDYTQAKRLL